ncbi:MAG: N-acyl-D-amino-acid deacylase family protein, partial [Actinomycetes bacterium]
MSHDLVIDGGVVVDGTGAPVRRADVAIDGDRITAIGEVDSGGARRVIDAEGRIVTPGFVDIHSHLDAQVGWDPTMSSSCWHGVTSVVMGNCGMTFAPVRPGDGPVLANAMESVEDIPASCIIDGLPWNWETFGEYLQAIESLPRGLNAGGYVGDVALRLYVCGDESCEDDFRASPDQLALMSMLVEQSMQDGALGYSISRSLFHRVPDGRNVPGTWSEPDEFYAIAEPLRRLGRGVIESAPRYNLPNVPGDRVDEELEWMAEISRRTGRPFCFNLQQVSSLGDHYRRVIELSQQANATGAQLRPQMTPRSVGVLFSLDGNSLLDDLPSFRPFVAAPLADKVAALRNPNLRAQLIAEGADKTFAGMYLMPADEPASYAHTDAESVAAIATARGVSAIECYVDELVRTDGASLVNWPVMNQDHAAIEHMVRSDVTIMGLADAGAHATQIMDA